MKNADTQEILLKLDHYNDIFSHFDVRPYSRRALSNDLLDEIRRATYDKSDDGIELVFCVPDEKRDTAQEEVIVERLTTHFRRHLSLLQEDKRKILTLGIVMVLLGVVSMIAATFVLFTHHNDNNLWFSFLVVFLEPAAWFLLWEGMDQIIFNSKGVKLELGFYQKMNHGRGRITFQPLPLDAIS